MTDRSKVAIVILGFNSRRNLGDLLDKAIDSALNQDYTNLEVLFVDNGSTDDSFEYVRSRYGNVIKIVRFHKNYGFCLGNNLAVQYIDGDVKYILFQNPDAILSRDYVRCLVETLEKNPDIGCIQGIQVPMNEGDIVFLGGGFIDEYGRALEFAVPRTLVEYLLRITNHIYVAWVSGSAMLIRRDLFEKLNGFPSEFFMYHDEIDLCSRIWLRGYKVAVSLRTMYWHKRGMTSGHNRVSWYFARRNRWLTTIRYLPLRYLVKALIVSLPLELLMNIIKSFRGYERYRVPLYIRIIKYIVKTFKQQVAIRQRWCIDIKPISNFIIDVKNSLIKDPQLTSKLVRKALDVLIWVKIRGNNTYTYC